MQENDPCQDGATWFGATAEQMSDEVGSGLHMISLWGGGASPTPGFPLVSTQICLPNTSLPALAGLIRRGENGVLLFGLAKVV
jgi:hypothetical protein